MRAFFNGRIGVLLLLLVIFFSSCTSKRDETNILLLTGNASPALEAELAEVAGRSQWHLEKVDDLHLLSEDSIGRFSSIVTTFSALKQLDPRGVIKLKRYLEAGAGGIVAVKDSADAPAEWSWLSKWNKTEAGGHLRQDNGRVSILRSDFSAEELTSALTYAIQDNQLPDYGKSRTASVPEASRYTYRVLAQGMDEPMQMAILPDNNVLIVERKGAVKFYNDSSRQIKTIAQFNVFSGIEDGLLGVALDPDYVANKWVYFYYAVAGDKSINRLSRMELRNNELDLSSEKTLLEIPTQRIYCCHSAGYLGFGPDKLLYLSTGDNTNAEDTEGYVPIDERPGRELSDDQATAANSNDLRGKILRIRPEADGSYSIPEGNLFPQDGSKGRPEIYIMGCRNPYRFSIDSKTNFLYWGDVGPDTKVEASEGTLSYDEINQARSAGFYGWPYFLGNNEAFPHYDFATKKEGPKFDAANPVNRSPNNTGVKELPPAQPAMIWYGDGSSKRFPLIGKGGESAMAGPVYYSDRFPSSDFKLPDYYDKKLFIYDWVRRWFMAVTLDENGNYVRMEPFLDHLQFIAPTDMQFASDGALYILEYGTNWFAKNTDAKLVRIEYAEGNRKPVANIRADRLYGAVPFEVVLSAAGSMDFDQGDRLSYSWDIEGKKYEGEQVRHTFTRAGSYQVRLTVQDSNEEETTSVLGVKAGNDPPQIHISTTANRSFYWSENPFSYRIEVKDKEDGKIDMERVNVSLDFLPHGKDLAVILTNPRASSKYLTGQNLLNGLDCKACHSAEQESVGPSYTAIAKRYAGQETALDQLAEKIITGGSGNWGQRPMSSHPDLSVTDAKEIVQYILSLANSSESLPLENTVHLKEHLGKGNDGSYLLMASYTDKGANGIEPLDARAHIALRNPLVQVEDFDEGNVRLGTITTEFLTFATGIHHKSFVKFEQIDLSHVKQFRYRLQSHGVGGSIEVRLGAVEGNLISTLQVPAGKSENLKSGWKEVNTRLTEEVSGIHDVYFVFTNPRSRKQNLFNVDWIYFGNGR
jgi:cytochrome c